MTGTPEIPLTALSVRQPWAWAIIHAGKDIENRSAVAVGKGGMRCRRIAIHAAKGMTREEYEAATDFMRTIGVTCSPAAELQRGGIIGAVDVVDVVKQHDSPWFFGPRGLVLQNPTASALIPCSGALGYFEWERNDAVAVDYPKWMRPAETAAKPLTVEQRSLFA